MAEQRIDAGGEIIDANSIAARIGAEAQAAIDAKLSEWFGREHDTYEPDALLDLARHVI